MYEISGLVNWQPVKLAVLLDCLTVTVMDTAAPLLPNLWLTFRLSASSPASQLTTAGPTLLVHPPRTAEDAACLVLMS